VALHPLVPVAMTLATSLRLLRHTQPGRTPRYSELAKHVGLEPRYVAMLEADQAPLLAEAGTRLLQALCVSPRDLAIAVLAIATVEQRFAEGSLSVEDAS
jgi:hypothetical protein